MTAYKLDLVDVSISDSEGVDLIVDIAIQNTLAPFFKWADETNTSIQFKKHVSDDIYGYHLKLSVTAEFETPEDLALFKISHTEFPKKTLNLGRHTNAIFV